MCVRTLIAFVCGRRWGGGGGDGATTYARASNRTIIVIVDTRRAWMPLTDVTRQNPKTLTHRRKLWFMAWHGNFFTTVSILSSLWTDYFIKSYSYLRVCNFTRDKSKCAHMTHYGKYHWRLYVPLWNVRHPKRTTKLHTHIVSTKFIPFGPVWTRIASGAR